MLMWFNIQFFTLAMQNLATMLRKPTTAAFVRAFIRPLESLYIKWFRFRLDNIYKLEHTGQVCYLRKSLNDKFDISQRRIYIGEGNDFSKTYIYTKAENNPKYLGRLYIRTKAETDTNLDFIVYVPQQIYNTQIYALRAHIDYYREGGTRYAIFIINE